MLPSKREKSSTRRSSILKLPKARQQPQNEDSDDSSEETGPVKLKRRVSFAEKKHVKEFADSVERGTVWDSTYEESDNHSVEASTSSHPVLSLPLSDTLIHQQLAALTSDPILLADKENNPAVLALAQQIDSSLIDDDVVTVRKVSVCPIISGTAGFSVYCDEDSVEEQPVDATNVQDVSMDCTLPATDSLFSSHSSMHAAGNGKRAKLDNSPMEMTEVVRTGRFVVEKSQFSRPTLVHNEDDRTDFYNKSMEMTEVVPGRRFSSIPRVNNEEKTQVFANESMEITEIIPGGVCAASREIQEVKTQFFDDTSMEMTEAVSQNHRRSERTQFFGDKSMEMTEIVSDKRFSVIAHSNMEERTQVYANKSMEMTEVIPDRHYTQSRRRDEEKTQFFADISMEMTEAVTKSHVCTEKTQFFPDKSMEMTEAVPSHAFPFIPRQTEEATQFYVNNSMEMTEAVPKSHISIEKTQFFPDKSMEMTEAVPSQAFAFIPQQNEEATQFFVNNSMEMTEAVPEDLRPSVEASIHNYFPEYTATINPNLKRTHEETNKSQEYTPPANPRPSCTLKDREMLHKVLYEPEFLSPSPIKSAKNQLPDENSHINEEMELTEVISSLKKPMTPPIQVQLPEELLRLTEKNFARGKSRKSIVVNDETYEFTAPIIVNKDTLDLSDIEAPSFIHDSIISTELPNIELQQRFTAVELPELSISDETATQNIANITKSPTESDDANADVEDNMENSTHSVDSSTKIDESNLSVSSLSETINPSAVELPKPAEPIAKSTVHGPKTRSATAIQTIIEEFDATVRKINQQRKFWDLKREEKKRREERRAEAAKVTEEIVEIVEKTPFQVLNEYLKKRVELCVNPYKFVIVTATTERIVIEYRANGMYLGIVFNEPNEENNYIESINRIRIVTRLSDEEKPVTKIVDYLLEKKINDNYLKELTDKYRTYDDVPLIIETITNEVISILNFHFDLKKLSQRNVIEFDLPRITFKLWANPMEIIVKICMTLKPFAEIRPSDIDASLTLGEVNTDDIKKLINNVHKDFKFLRNYMALVCEYIDVMQQTSLKNLHGKKL